MFELLRVFGIVLAAAAFATAVFIFFKMNIPSAIRYFTGTDNKRLKEYQKMKRNYLKNAGKKSSLTMKKLNSKNSAEASSIDDGTATLLDVNSNESMNKTEVDFANALYLAQSTTTLLSKN